MKARNLSPEAKQNLLRAWEWIIAKNISDKAQLLRASILLACWLLIGWNNNRTISHGLEGATGLTYGILTIGLYMTWFTTMIFVAVYGSIILGYFRDRWFKRL
jgi:hypothetical protein